MPTNNQNRRQFLGRMASVSAGITAVLGRATFASVEQKSLTPRSKPIGDPNVPLEVILLGTGVYDGQNVQLSHVLNDKDII